MSWSCVLYYSDVACVCCWPHEIPILPPLSLRDIAAAAEASIDSQLATSRACVALDIFNKAQRKSEARRQQEAAAGAEAKKENDQASSCLHLLYCTQGPLCHITIHKWRLTLSVSFHVISCTVQVGDGEEATAADEGVGPRFQPSWIRCRCRCRCRCKALLR